MNASAGPGEIAMNHEARKLENAQLKVNARKDQEKMEEMRLKMEELQRTVAMHTLGGVKP